MNSTSPLIAAGNIPQASAHTVIIDARSGPDAYERYLSGHPAGAYHADLDRDLAKKPVDASQGGRHPLQDINIFTSLLGTFGILPDTTVIVYDDKAGANAAARFWWMLRAVGHQKVFVVDGGLDAMKAAGVPFTTEVPAKKNNVHYPATEWLLPIASLEDVQQATADTQAMVIDVREAYRYRGEREPIDLVAGHIPGAVNMPYLNNLDSEGKFLAPAQLAALYHEAMGDRNPEDVIVHCGSGVTACHTLLAMDQAGLPGAKLYVGSWSEWSRRDLPVGKA